MYPQQPDTKPSFDSNDKHGFSFFERVLNVIKNFIVIITCLVILYVVFQGYMALHELTNRLHELNSTFGSLGTSSGD